MHRMPPTRLVQWACSSFRKEILPEDLSSLNSCHKVIVQLARSSSQPTTDSRRFDGVAAVVALVRFATETAAANAPMPRTVQSLAKMEAEAEGTGCHWTGRSVWMQKQLASQPRCFPFQKAIMVDSEDSARNNITSV